MDQGLHCRNGSENPRYFSSCLSFVGEANVVPSVFYSSAISAPPRETFGCTGVEGDRNFLNTASRPSEGMLQSGCGGRQARAPWLWGPIP